MYPFCQTGHYAFMQSLDRQPEDEASLISQTYSVTEGECFTFFYHMHGDTLGSLAVLIKVEGQGWVEVWKHSNSEKDVWNRALVTVKSPHHKFKVQNI